MKRKLKKFKIGGFTYKIKWDYEFKEVHNLAGQCDYGAQEIRIRSVDDGGAKYTDAYINDSFYHELLHAIGNSYNIKELFGDESEELIGSLSKALVDLFTNNPKLIDDLNTKE